MSADITISIWLFILLIAVAAWAILERVLIPSTRWLIRRRINRLIDEIDRYMTSRGLRDKYDHIILAGASLGAITEKYPAWNKTFWGHLDVAIQLHHIHKVIVMDHRDCGAYKVILEKDFYQDPVKETAIHSEKLNELRRQIKAKYPKLEVELLLMDLNGKIENIVPKG